MTCYDKTKGYGPDPDVNCTIDCTLDCTMICTDSSNQTKVEEDCAGLGIDSANSANIGCGARDTSYCTVESRTNAGKCDNC